MTHKILTPTDGSETAQRAVRFAQDIALAEGASVLVLGVAHAVQFGDSTGYDVMPQLMEDERQFVDDEVKMLTEAGVDASGKVVSGDQPYQSILDNARSEDADLIVMGTHGRTGLARAIIGSVADRVVRHAEVPVVLVPSR
jgi:nucleotide-binding universal stress UspA family protein